MGALTANAGRAGVPMVRASTNVASNVGRSAGVPGSYIGAGTTDGLVSQQLRNIFAGIGGVGGGGMIAGSVGNEEEEFDVGPSVMDDRKQINPNGIPATIPDNIQRNIPATTPATVPVVVDPSVPVFDGNSDDYENYTPEISAENTKNNKLREQAIDNIVAKSVPKGKISLRQGKPGPTYITSTPGGEYGVQGVDFDNSVRGMVPRATASNLYDMYDDSDGINW